ncbi:hypothetical protein [Mycolicibacterium sp. HK-90]|nr:hypothetical protein [Mycolicibacterium sp. HK-90]WKG03942.1 hypothetical protein QU592_02035 [Mycolicibacterium sp. HK-90]
MTEVMAFDRLPGNASATAVPAHDKLAADASGIPASSASSWQ